MNSGTRRRAAAPLTEESGLRAAYAAHGPELYRFALRALGDPGAAEEVVQDVFLRAWRASDRYDPTLASLRVWLFAIARNCVIDRARVRTARPWDDTIVDVTDRDDSVPHTRDPVEEVVQAWLVEEALRRVSDDHRRAIVEIHLRGRGYDEVAAELGVPPGTLRSRLFYGLKALRLALDEMGVTAS